MKRISYLLAIFSGITFGSIEKLPQKVVVCGVCKNVANRLPYTINIMEKIGNLFSDYRIVVYENNSSDSTPNILATWRNKNSKVLAISEVVSNTALEKIIINRTEDQKFFVPEAIARARNLVLDIVLSDRYQNFDYLIWMDMDFKCEPSYEAFKEVFTADKPWDAVFAYGIAPDGEYWDWYALRDAKMPLGPEVLGDCWWPLPRKKMAFLDQKDDWYPVYSAFGGCGIYKKSSIEGCRYSGLVTRDLGKLYSRIITEKTANSLVQKYLQDLKTLSRHITIHNPSSNLPAITDQNTGIVVNKVENIIWRMNSFVYNYPAVCEHVTFHASMITRGHAKLFINPRLIFRYSS